MLVSVTKIFLREGYLKKQEIIYAREREREIASKKENNVSKNHVF